MDAASTQLPLWIGRKSDWKSASFRKMISGECIIITYSAIMYPNKIMTSKKNCQTNEWTKLFVCLGKSKEGIKFWTSWYTYVSLITSTLYDSVFLENTDSYSFFIKYVYQPLKLNIRRQVHWRSNDFGLFYRIPNLLESNNEAQTSAF